MITVEVFGAPRGKGRPRFIRSTGMAYTPAETRSYENLIRAAAQEKMIADNQSPLDCAVALRMIATYPVPQSWSKKKQGEALAGRLRPIVKPDADNLLKLTDALNNIVFVDDKQVVSAEVYKRYGEQPSLRIEIRVMP